MQMSNIHLGVPFSCDNTSTHVVAKGHARWNSCRRVLHMPGDAISWRDHGFVKHVTSIDKSMCRSPMSAAFCSVG